MSDRASRVRVHLEAADRATARFAAASGLTCPPGCGACCASPDVTASAAELAPLAETFVQDGRALPTLEALAAGDRAGPCVLYRPDPEDPRRGRCSAYADRPLLCRLFGFGARRSRTGALEPVACRTLLAAHPTAQADLTTAPVLADHAHALAADLPDDARLLPINQALHDALHRALLHHHLTLAADPDPDDPPTTPPLAAA